MSLDTEQAHTVSTHTGVVHGCSSEGSALSAFITTFASITLCVDYPIVVQHSYPNLLLMH